MAHHDAHPCVPLARGTEPRSGRSTLFLLRDLPSDHPPYHPVRAPKPAKPEIGACADPLLLRAGSDRMVVLMTRQSAPPDVEACKAVKPVTYCPVDILPKPEMALYASARFGATLTDTIMMPPRDARCFTAPPGIFSHHIRRRSAGGRSQSLERRGPDRAVLFRQNPRASWDAYHHRRLDVAQLSRAPPHGHDRSQHARLVRDRRPWRIGS